MSYISIFTLLENFVYEVKGTTLNMRGKTEKRLYVQKNLFVNKSTEERSGISIEIYE